MIDVAQRDHLVVALAFRKGLLEHVFRILLITLKKLAVGSRHPARGVKQTLTSRVVSRPLQQNSDGRFGVGLSRSVRQFGAAVHSGLKGGDMVEGNGGIFARREMGHSSHRTSAHG